MKTRTIVLLMVVFVVGGCGPSYISQLETKIQDLQIKRDVFSVGIQWIPEEKEKLLDEWKAYQELEYQFSLSLNDEQSDAFGKLIRDVYTNPTSSAIQVAAERKMMKVLPPDKFEEFVQLMSKRENLMERKDYLKKKIESAKETIDDFNNQIRAHLEELEREGIVRTRRGVGRGKRVERQDEIVGMPLLDSQTFPKGTLMYFDAAQLHVNKDPFLYKGHSKDLSAFKLPQLILKLGWRKDEAGRFKAALVKSNEELGPVVCSSIYISVHAPIEYESLLESACLSLNSIIAVYFSLLSSGRFAFYRPSPNKENLLRIPIPKCKRGVLKEIERIEDVDVRVRQLFGLKDSEWVLVEDLFNYTLQDFKGGMNSLGRRPTRALDGEQEDRESEFVLKAYCEYFSRVLRAGFGEDKQVSATIFTERSEPFLPVRLVGIHLETPGKAFIKLESIDSPELIKRLKELDKKFLKSPSGRTNGGIFYQRIARIYDTISIGGRKVPTVFIVKPDQVRYWTRSMAMRDADEIAGDIMLWREESEAK